MKSIHTILAMMLISISPIAVSAQAQKAQKAPQGTQAPKFKFCTVPADSMYSSKMALTTIQEWANDLPLKILCDQKNNFTLKQFQMTIITKSPMQSRDFGLANNGIPILGRKAIDQMKPGDTIFMKDVVGADKDGKEIKLPSIVISVSE
ncbi:MAG: hypothetical protein RLZZ630_987 [Bacteroidota bacterium]|jgi:hypothetical protein